MVELRQVNLGDIITFKNGKKSLLKMGPSPFMAAMVFLDTPIKAITRIALL